jgi:hypothetical protein
MMPKLRILCWTFCVGCSCWVCWEWWNAHHIGCAEHVDCTKIAEYYAAHAEYAEHVDDAELTLHSNYNWAKFVLCRWPSCRTCTTRGSSTSSRCLKPRSEFSSSWRSWEVRLCLGYLDLLSMRDLLWVSSRTWTCPTVSLFEWQISSGPQGRRDAAACKMHIARHWLGGTGNYACICGSNHSIPNCDTFGVGFHSSQWQFPDWNTSSSVR